MALENYRITEFQEKTQVDNGDYVLIDSATDGTHKYQLSRIPAQASAEMEAAVAAEKTAREAADAAEVTARNAAISAAISDEVTARNAAIAANVDNTLTVSGKAADAKKTGDEIADVKSDLSEHGNILSTTLMGIDVQDNLYPGAADWSGIWNNSDSVNMGLSNETFEGYPVIYSSQSWRRYNKNIPVVSGKTYTFEAWIKHGVADGIAYLYIIHGTDTTNPATVSVSSKQFKNVPANTWVKLSVTFTCSASGNISPYALSSSGAFYIAKYNLVEGESVFSLDSTLKSKATKEEISGIGDYLKYTFSIGTSPGTYWNPIINKTVSKGTKVRLIFDSYNGQYLNYVRVDAQKNDQTWDTNLCKIINPVHGGTAEFVAAANYVALRIQFYRTTDEGNVTASVFIATNGNLGITSDLLGMSVGKVFYVEKDGTGDFDSLVEAIQTATQYMNSVVYVGKGEWDLIDEFGSSYMENVTSDPTTWGIVLKNGIHVVGSSQSVIKCIYTEEEYDRTHPENLPGATVYFSVFNAGEGGFTIENLTIEDAGIRYSVHDDLGGAGSTPYTNKYINCKMIHRNGMYSDCIGGGIGESCYVEIRGCYFKGDGSRSRLAYYHGNNNGSVTDAQAHIIVCDNYFDDNGTFKLTNYGNSTTVSEAYVSNNSFGSAPEVTDGSSPSPIIVNMKLIQWNNEIRAT